MGILHTIIIILQLVTALALILIIAIQTTKSEQSGSSMGWGTIGGQASTSVTKFGLDAQISRVTAIIAIAFFALSFIAAIIEASMK